MGNSFGTLFRISTWGESHGGGIGVVAESALKPGLFALLDSSGDRELQQLHAALGAGAGGARRVVFAALREEHKHTHKFTGRV